MIHNIYDEEGSLYIVFRLMKNQILHLNLLE